SSRPFSPPANDRGPTPDLGRPTNTFAAAPLSFRRYIPFYPIRNARKRERCNLGSESQGALPLCWAGRGGEGETGPTTLFYHALNARNLLHCLNISRPHSRVTGRRDLPTRAAVERDVSQVQIPHSRRH